MDSAKSSCIFQVSEVSAMTPILHLKKIQIRGCKAEHEPFLIGFIYTNFLLIVEDILKKLRN
jgi:hypothetical protein